MLRTRNRVSSPTDRHASTAGSRRALAAGAALALSAGLVGAGATSSAALTEGAGDSDLGAAVAISAPAAASAAVSTQLAPGSALVNPARAFAVAGSIAALQAKSLKLIAAEQKAVKDKAAKDKAAKDKAAKSKAAKSKAAKAVASARGSQTASRGAARGGSPKAIGRALASQRGWGGAQFACLEKLWEKESNWRPTADNPSSSAYGIPQALPGSKMRSHGSDWRTNPATQIAWGLDYIADRYGSPCSAWAHSRANNWY